MNRIKNPITALISPAGLRSNPGRENQAAAVNPVEVGAEEPLGEEVIQTRDPQEAAEEVNRTQNRPVEGEIQTQETPAEAVTRTQDHPAVEGEVTLTPEATDRREPEE
jgi:hypothetical protein